MRTIVLDTSVIVHLLPREPIPGQEEQRRDAQQVLDERLLIPTVVVAEVLAGSPPVLHGALRAAMLALGRVLPFTLLTADIAGRSGPIRRKGGYQGDRQAVKVDAFVCAHAVEQGAEMVCTYDVADFRTLMGRMGSQIQVASPVDLRPPLFRPAAPR